MDMTMDIQKITLPSASRVPPMLVHLDDNILQHDHMKIALTKHFLVESFDASEDFFNRMKARPMPNLVLIDIDLGDDEYSGIGVVKRLRGLYPDLVILMHSGKVSAGTITDSLVAGADEFIAKGDDEKQLCNQIMNAFVHVQFKRGVKFLEGISSKTISKVVPRKFAGSTFERIQQRSEKIVQSAVSAVHVSGESGVGKEIVADLFEQAIGKPIVRVNCAAIAPSLLESELFGYKKGAFTGAVQDKIGLIERANGGWIFLDEVAELSSEAQSALLRVLSQKRELIPVGGTQARKVNVRVISASNKNLESLVAEGRFRQDLWQRLSDVVIEIPPLRDRRNEIEDLAKYFCSKMADGPYVLSKAALEVLKELPWAKGNVRELENCLRAMTEHAQDKVLTPLSIPKKSWEQLLDTESDRNDIADTKKNKVPSTEYGAFISFEDGFLMRDLQNKLFLQVLFSLRQSEGRLTLRGVAKQTGLARTTIELRLKEIIANQLASIDDINGLFKKMDFH